LLSNRYPPHVTNGLALLAAPALACAPPPPAIVNDPSSLPAGRQDPGSPSDVRTKEGRYDGHAVTWLDHPAECGDSPPRLRIVGTGTQWLGRTAPGARDRGAGLERAREALVPLLPKSAVDNSAAGTVGSCAEPVLGLRITVHRWSDIDLVIPRIGAFMKDLHLADEIDLEAPAPPVR
jgi:hypothetical protein